MDDNLEVLPDWSAYRVVQADVSDLLDLSKLRGVVAVCLYVCGRIELLSYHPARGLPQLVAKATGGRVRIEQVP